MKKGFTLIELLVVLSVVSLLTGIFFFNYRQGEREIFLSRAAVKLAQDLRRAEEMALSEIEYQGQRPAGYGIYFENSSSSYILYGDMDNNKKYTSGEEIETIFLERGIVISLSTSSLSVNFEPPNPKVKIGNDLREATITLYLEKDPNKTKSVKVNKIGLIYVE